MSCYAPEDVYDELALSPESQEMTTRFGTWARTPLIRPAILYPTTLALQDPSFID